MESLFTKKSGNSKEIPDSKLDEFTQIFKESLDVLNSINEISSMREKMGKVNHSYNIVSNPSKINQPRLNQNYPYQYS